MNWIVPSDSFILSGAMMFSFIIFLTVMFAFSFSFNGSSNDDS